MTPGAIAALRSTLPPLQGGLPPPPALDEWLRFYRLDFSDRHPAARCRAGSVPSGAIRLAVHRWIQPGARDNLALVHGFLDHSGLYSRLIECGLRRGSNVLVYDQPGHGLSGGSRCSVDEFGDYARALADVLAAAGLPDLPRWVMAQSMGAAALIEFGRRHPWPFAAAVLLAPLVRPAGWLPLRLAHGLLRQVTATVPRRFARNSSDPEFLAFLRAGTRASRRAISGLDRPW